MRAKDIFDAASKRVRAKVRNVFSRMPPAASIAKWSVASASLSLFVIIAAWSSVRAWGILWSLSAVSSSADDTRLSVMQLYLAVASDVLAIVALFFAYRALRGDEEQTRILAEERVRRSKEVVLFSNFQDPVFQTLLREKHRRLFGSAEPHPNGFTDEELKKLDYLDISNSAVKTLEGIGALKHLTGVNCSNTLLATIDFVGLDELRVLTAEGCANLTRVMCPLCSQLHALRLSGSPVKMLDCSGTAVDIERLTCAATIEELVCRSVAPARENGEPGASFLTSIDLDVFPRLAWLSCGDNDLRELKATNTSPLLYLDATGSPLRRIPFDNVPDLSTLTCMPFFGMDEDEFRSYIERHAPRCRQLTIVKRRIRS